jgi:hypothetical protein
MSYYEAQIDGTDFGLIAGYLKSPRSPIEALLHVKNKAALVRLAEQLAPDIESNQRRVLQAIEGMVKDGSLKISLRPGLAVPDRIATMDPAIVPRSARCEVIYLPPFYVVHTPGLFEGEFLSPSVTKEQRQKEAIAPALEHLRKLNGPRHGL